MWAVWKPHWVIESPSFIISVTNIQYPEVFPHGILIGNVLYLMNRFQHGIMSDLVHVHLVLMSRNQCMNPLSTVYQLNNIRGIGVVIVEHVVAGRDHDHD